VMLDGRWDMPVLRSVTKPEQPCRRACGGLPFTARYSNARHIPVARLREYEAMRCAMAAIEAATADRSLDARDLGGYATTAQATAAECALIERGGAGASAAA
jgi:hypothetical protein